MDEQNICSTLARDWLRSATYILAVVDIVLLKTWFQSVNNSAMNPTNGRDKNTTTYCTKLPRHTPRTYMSTTNKKERTNVENVHDAKKHDGSSPALPNSSAGKMCSGKENTWCSSRCARLILKAVCDLEVHMERCYHA